MKYIRHLPEPAKGEYKARDNEDVYTLRVNDTAYELSDSEIQGIFGTILWGRKKHDDYLDWAKYLSDTPDEEWVSLTPAILNEARTLTWPEFNYDFEDRYKDVAVASDVPPDENDLRPLLVIRDALINFVGSADSLEVRYEWRA